MGALRTFDEQNEFIGMKPTDLQQKLEGLQVDLDKIDEATSSEKGELLRDYDEDMLRVCKSKCERALKLHPTGAAGSTRRRRLPGSDEKLEELKWMLAEIREGLPLLDERMKTIRENARCQEDVAEAQEDYNATKKSLLEEAAQLEEQIRKFKSLKSDCDDNDNLEEAFVLAEDMSGANDDQRLGPLEKHESLRSLPGSDFFPRRLATVTPADAEIRMVSSHQGTDHATLITMSAMFLLFMF